MHQKVRASITKRAGPLHTAVKKYNGYCDKLRELSQPSWKIALPPPMDSTALDQLKESPDLYEDVWIYPESAGPPKWLTDQSVRAGIKATLRIQRCEEEQRRLYTEADNLLRWYHARDAAIQRLLDPVTQPGTFTASVR